MAGNGELVVVDASVIIGWLLPDESTNEQAQAWLKDFNEKRIDLTAPTLLSYEVVNALKSAVKRRRANLNQVKRMADKFLALGIKFEPMDRWAKTMIVLADKLNLSVYDTAYVVLAKKLKVKLLSLDKRLAKL